MRHWVGLVVLCACGEGAVEPLPEAFELSDEVAHPEGVTFHEPTRSFIMGSLGHGGVTQLTADGEELELFRPEEGWTTLGTKVHEATGDVLMCAVWHPSQDDAESELWVIGVEDAEVRRIPLAGAPNNCNDVASEGDDVYLTDRESSRIHRVDLGSETAEVWLTHELLEPGIIGNNGIVLTDEPALIVGQYAPAKLLHVPLADPSAIREIPLSGDDIGTLPDGADGIAWVGDDLLIAANSRVARVSSDDAWATATVVASEAPVPIAAVTVAEGQAYGLKGEVVPFVLGTPVSLPFELVQLDLP